MVEGRGGGEDVWEKRGEEVGGTRWERGEDLALDEMESEGTEERGEKGHDTVQNLRRKDCE